MRAFAYYFITSAVFAAVFAPNYFTGVIVALSLTCLFRMRYA